MDIVQNRIDIVKGTPRAELEVRRKKFLCKICGCEFVASHTEWRDVIDTAIKGFHYLCPCPICGHMAWENGWE